MFTQYSQRIILIILILYFFYESWASDIIWKSAAPYSCVVLQDKRRDVDLLGSDAGEELLQVVKVTDLLLDPWHAEGGEEPRRDLD